MTRDGRRRARRARKTRERRRDDDATTTAAATRAARDGDATRDATTTLDALDGATEALSRVAVVPLTFLTFPQIWKNYAHVMAGDLAAVGRGVVAGIRRGDARKLAVVELLRG